jgi:His/Glu/Gln/Arg/opine family amino acid ABC transporter permease subunit
MKPSSSAHPAPTDVARPADGARKFMRTHPGWFHQVRRPLFVVLTFALLLGYGLFLLPVPGTVSPGLLYASVGVFLILILAWSGNVLSDRDKPEALKMIVALALIGVLAWLFYRYSGADWAKLAEFFLNFKVLKGNWWYLGNGLAITLLLAAISAAGSVVIGLLVAVLRTLNSRTLNLFLKAYVDVFRSIPMIVLMVVLFFALPFAGISLGSILTTVVALSLGYGAYASESFRAGIESVHPGQVEAARSLGLSRWQTIRMVILPQAIPVVIPPLTGNLVSMLKDTAVASLVAAPELLKKARELYTSKTNPTSLVAAALIYLAVLVPLVRIVNLLEKRFKKEAK